MKKSLASSPTLWTLAALLLALFLWEGGGRGGWIDPFFFSRPTLIWADLLAMTQEGFLQKHLAVTAKEAGLGLLLGGGAGTLTGVVLGTLPRLSQALTPLMTGLNGLPKLALGPLIIVWFGIGLKAKVLISALMTFFVFAFNLHAAVRGTDRGLLEAVTLLGANRRQRLLKVVWPSCLPWVLSSLRTGLGLAISGAIVGEYLGASQGLGWAITAAGERYNTTRVLALVLVIVVGVILLDGGIRLAERRLLRWREAP